MPQDSIPTAGPIVQKDSRRLPGANLLWDRPSAILDVGFPDGIGEHAVALWEESARRILDAVGWKDEGTRSRVFPGGANLAISAPIDCLYAATEVNEWALVAANAQLGGPVPPPFEEAVQALRRRIETERKPRLLAMRLAARRNDVSFLWDDLVTSVGSGTGSLSWPTPELPDPDSVDWSAVRDVPTVLVTGSNGKTTTVRLLTAVATAGGHVVGMSCTDSVHVGSSVLAEGDFSGPMGARMVLRDKRVELAVLETARGGILRRGITVPRARAAIVTNIAEDHFGEFGVFDLHSLAETKLVVARPVAPSGRIVLNADDIELVRAAPGIRKPLFWISHDPENRVLRAHVAQGGDAAWVEDGMIVAAFGGERIAVTGLADVPITLNGVARHNVLNALGVAALALTLGLSAEVTARGLRNFRGTPGENPGRLNIFDLGGVRVVVDFAHNPHGMDALVQLAAALPAARRALIIGQAGDRDDQAIRDFAKSAWGARPSRIVLKEMEKYRRGRAVGEASGILRAEFLRLGAAPDSIEHADTEFAAVRAALSWARSGDLLLLPLHAERARVLAFLDQLQAEGWKPGVELPESGAEQHSQEP
jgi:UDP-N-acetylmuramyl tripeptide synthase